MIAPFIYLKDLTNFKTFDNTYRCLTNNLKHSPQKRLSSVISSVNFYCVSCVHSSRQEQCTCYWLQRDHNKELIFTLEHYVKSLQNSIWASNQSNYKKSRHMKASSKYSARVSSVTSRPSPARHGHDPKLKRSWPLKISTWNILTSTSSWPSKKIKSIRLKCLTHYETKKVLIEMVFRWVHVEGLEQTLMEILQGFKQMSACWKIDMNIIFNIRVWHCIALFHLPDERKQLRCNEINSIFSTT